MKNLKTSQWVLFLLMLILLGIIFFSLPGCTAGRTVVCPNIHGTHKIRV